MCIPAFLRIASLIAGIAAIAIPCGEAMHAAESASVLRLRPVASLPLDDRSQGILVPLTIGAKESTALLDTGSLGHFLDQSLATKLGPALPAATGQTPAGERRFRRHVLPDSVRVAGIPAGTGEAALFDTAALSAAAGRTLSGTLGLAVMRRHCWCFDFDRNTLTVGERMDPVPEGTTPAPADSLLHLPVEFPGGVFIPFMLDTGAAGWGTLEGELFDAMAARGLLRLLPEKTTLTTSAGTLCDVPQAVLRGLKLNGQDLPEITLVRSDASRIGWKLFTCFNWQIDLSRSEIFLTPRAPEGARTTISTPTKNKKT